MPLDDEIKKPNKKWTSRWWGIVIMTILAILLLYVGNFIYQVVFFLEEQQNYYYDTVTAFNSFKSSSRGDLTDRIRELAETSDDPADGPETAEIVIVEFCDFQCPYCKQAQTVLMQVKQSYPETVKIIFRDYPDIVNHPLALETAIASECADEQGKFWQIHDYFFANQQDLTDDGVLLIAEEIGLDMDLFNQCLDDNKYLNEVQGDMQDGLSLGVEGTPTFFINGLKIPGAIAYSDFQTIITSLLNPIEE